MYIVYIPFYIYYLWLAMRAKSIFFFTASNPGIENGGMLGESKFPILEKIEKKPYTLWFDHDVDVVAVDSQLKQSGLSYPVIAKPDVGERGWGVKRLDSMESLRNYLDWISVPFLIQEFVNLPIEAGVFYHRMPEEKTGNITSLVLKEFLFVTGDGVSTLRELISRSDRAVLQIEKLESEWKQQMEDIIPAGEKVELVGIGNHALGTKFINGEHLINDNLIHSFDKIANKIDGFFYGRFDLKCASYDDLENGIVRIMELNGAGSEPAHIYEPGYSFFKAQKALLQHMKLLYMVSTANHKRGVDYMSFREGIAEIRKIRDYNRTHKYG